MTIINTRESILGSARRDDFSNDRFDPPKATSTIDIPARPHYTLDTFNAQQMEMYDRMAASRLAHPNNIACPRCSAELWDDLPLAALTVNPATIDPANPPHQQVSCRACKWQGLRLL